MFPVELSTTTKETNEASDFQTKKSDEEDPVGSCCSDNWDISTSSYNVSYHFLVDEEEGNDRGYSHVNNPSAHYERPLSTTSNLSSSTRSLGGVEVKGESESVSVALNKIPTSCFPESKTPRFTTQQSQSESISYSTEDSSSSSRNRRIRHGGRLSQSESCSSTSSERSNETPSSSLASLPFTLETSCIATTSVDPQLLLAMHPIECGNSNSEPSTSIWAGTGTCSKRNADTNSSRASSLFSSPLSENQISPSAVVSQSQNEALACNYYNVYNKPTLSFTNSSQRNKKKVKSRTRAGNKSDFPSDYSTQSATNLHNRWIFSARSEDQKQKEQKIKRSYSYYIKKIKQFHQNLLSTKNSPENKKSAKIKPNSVKVKDSSIDSSQLIATIPNKAVPEDNPYTYKVMDNKDTMNNKTRQVHLKAQPTIKITVSPDTPDMENQNNQPNIPFEAVKTAVSNKIFIGDPSDSFSVEDFARLDFPNCVDFGITDFLCCKDEVDVDLSSDTDTSFLEATPPHRFSDSELEQIEAMSITLDTALNLNPKMESILLNSADGSDDKKAISAPPEMESETAKEFLEKDLIFTLKQLQANNLMKSTGNDSAQPARKVLPKPFRRHISLPATVFMRYIFDHDNKVAESPNESQRNKRLPKINSLSGGSSENIYEDSCSCSNDNDSDSISNISNDWVSKSDSIDLEQDEFENQAFTSDIEKRSLIVRHMRRLIRQDTSGNFAPPDFCI